MLLATGENILAYTQVDTKISYTQYTTTALLH